MGKGIRNFKDGLNTDEDDEEQKDTGKKNNDKIEDDKK